MQRQPGGEPPLPSHLKGSRCLRGASLCRFIRHGQLGGDPELTAGILDLERPRNASGSVPHEERVARKRNV